MKRPYASRVVQVHAMRCDCDACDPRPGASALGDLGAASFFAGANVGLLFALGHDPAATMQSLLAVFGIGL